MDNEMFTVDAKANPWVTKNLKKFVAEHRQVICKITEDKLLLSVRLKNG